MQPRPAWVQGAVAGAVAGVSALATMYLAAWMAALQPLPDVLQQSVLSVLPGPVFGFLIDTLQHLGKVVEEAGLLVAMLIGLTALGAAYGAAVARRPIPHLALAFAAIPWLVVVFGLLPAAGQGPLGLAGGFAVPLEWGVIAAIYGLVLETGWRSFQVSEPTDQGRRRILLAVGGFSLVVLGFRLLPAWYRTAVAPPEAGMAGISPEITPPSRFYVVSKNFQDPDVAISSWVLRVRGLVEQPLSLTHQSLREVPAVKQLLTLECISNNVGGPQMSTQEFTGASLRELISRAGPRTGASAVNFKAHDGYTESLPLSMVMGAPEILVAYELGGAPLEKAHGFPARILIPGHYGMKGPKWLDEIEVAGSEMGGFWEAQGWDRRAIVKTTARIDTPVDRSVVRTGPVVVGGVAFAGSRGISAVEFSVDGGRSWSAAHARPPLSPLTWVIWEGTWTPSQQGVATLMARARDGDVALQTSKVAPSFPDGASGYHTIQVSIGR
jgi:DMSO/TMAO reductase YedYZ molybdopterin-dependent catalytic subunit